MHKFGISLIGLLFSLCASIACAQTASIKIALVAPFTGQYAAYGTQLLSGASQAANDLNNKGGVKGVKIEIMPFDDQCNPDLAVRRAEEILANKQLHVVIGHVCSAPTLAALNLYAKQGMLMLTPTATNSKITERNVSTVFRMIGTDQQQSQVAAEFIAKKLKRQRVAILHDQDLYSKELADMVSESLLRLGTSPILYQGVARGTRNFTSIIKKLKALNADAVYFAGLYAEVAALSKTLSILQLQIPLITADGIAINKFISTVGNQQLASAVLFTFPQDPNSLISSQMVINHMQQQKLETTGYALYAYASVQVLARAIDATNTTDGKTLASWLHQHQVDTILGNKSWDTSGNVIDPQFHVYALRAENKLEQIY